MLISACHFYVVDEFKVFAKKKPEYARLFINYHGIQVNSDGTSDNLDLASKVKEE